MSGYGPLTPDDLRRALDQLKHEASPEGVEAEAQRAEQYRQWLQDRMAGEPLPMLPTS